MNTTGDGNGVTGGHGNGGPPLRVLIADDDPFARRVIRDALQAAGIVVIGEADDGTEAVELALHYRPDIVLMDVLMPGTDGIAAAGRIRDRASEVRIVLLSANVDVELGIMGLRAGAAGYVTKSADVTQLPATLARVAAGEAAVDPRLAAALIDELRKPPHQGPGSRPVDSALTDREWAVLDLLDTGLEASDIAERLVVSIDTVRSHVKSLHRKLGVHSREELVGAIRALRAPASPQSRGR
jgi:NarL family two-component system response regulator LiaR